MYAFIPYLSFSLVSCMHLVVVCYFILVVVCYFIWWDYIEFVFGILNISLMTWLKEFGAFPLFTQIMSNNHFSIYIQSLTHLLYGLSESFTIRIGIFPIRVTDYRYKLIFLHGSTCWLGDQASPTIQLDKLSSLAQLSKSKLEIIGGTWLMCFSYWPFAVCLMDKSDAASTMTITKLHWSMIV